VLSPEQDHKGPVGIVKERSQDRIAAGGAKLVWPLVVITHDECNARSAQNQNSKHRNFHLEPASGVIGALYKIRMHF
jgi:hypothetical protein